MKLCIVESYDMQCITERIYTYGRVFFLTAAKFKNAITLTNQMLQALFFIYGIGQSDLLKI